MMDDWTWHGIMQTLIGLTTFDETFTVVKTLSDMFLYVHFSS